MEEQQQSFRIFPNEVVLSVWREGLAKAAQNPALRHQLLHRERELLPRFAEHYQKLKALPRPVRRDLQRKWKQPLAGVALLLPLGQVPALAATINVGGGCNLVDAITAANTNNAIGGCRAGKRADTIVLPRGSTQTLRRVDNRAYGPTGLPVITSRVTISGQVSTIRRVTSAPKFRIFAVDSTGNLTLKQTTVTGGEISSAQAGGGILNNGSLTLTHSTVSDNSSGTEGYGGGIYSKGTLIITNSTISGNSSGQGGGGVHNSGTTLKITNSTVSRNHADESGGGVGTDGTFTRITNSTISGNDSNIGGGGLFVAQGLAMLRNSTVSRNTAYYTGGGVDNRGTLTVTNSTISGNTVESGTGTIHFGGGLANSFGGILRLVRTLVSGNTAPTAPEVHHRVDTPGTVIANNFNLLGRDGDAGVVGFSPVVPSDIVPSVALNAILDPNLADNGGPTKTHALVKGSRAVDAVIDGSCPPPRRDQWGIRRPQNGDTSPGAFCDIGAFERRPRE